MGRPLFHGDYDPRHASNMGASTMSPLALTGSTSTTMDLWPGIYGSSALMFYDVPTVPDTVTEETPTLTVELRAAVGGRMHIEIFGEPPTWYLELIDKVRALLELPPGWNSHAAAPVPLEAARTLLIMAEESFEDATS